jgi:hypothetical protein
MDSASNEDLDAWTWSSEEYELSTAKIGANRLDFALLLKCFQIVGRFPSATRLAIARCHPLFTITPALHRSPARHMCGCRHFRAASSLSMVFTIVSSPLR